jgi:hypothetical protein
VVSPPPDYVNLAEVSEQAKIQETRIVIQADVQMKDRALTDILPSNQIIAAPLRVPHRARSNRPSRVPKVRVGLVEILESIVLGSQGSSEEEEVVDGREKWVVRGLGSARTDLVFTLFESVKATKYGLTGANTH